MTGPWIEYLLRLTLIWGSLLIYYHFFFSQNHNWTLRRRFLIGSYLIGLVIPLLPSMGLTAEPIPLSNVQFGTYFVSPTNPIIAEQETSTSFDWYLLFVSIYLLGTFVQLIRLGRHYLLLQYWNSKGIKSSFRSFRVIRHTAITSPFATWRSIFLPLQLSPEVEEVAYLHEAAHLRYAHSLERLPMILGQVILWFHPLQWIFESELSAIQEFQADEAVTQEISKKTYGHILIQQSMLPTDHWQPGLFASPLKKRIHMMVNKKKSQPWRWPQLTLFLGLLGVLTFSCSDLISTAQPDYADAISYTAADQIPILVTSDDADSSKSPINRALLENVYRNIRYPATARQNGLEGLVIARFVINEQGKLKPLLFNTKDGKFVVGEGGKLNYSPGQASFNNVPADQDEIVVVGYGDNSQNEATEGIDMNILVEEVNRVISELPDWKPAMRDGKAVTVAMHLGVKFKLE